MTAARSGFVLSASVVLVGLALSPPGGRVQAQRPVFDLLIRGGRVVDGTGNPWFSADVAVAGDTIVAIGSTLDAGTARIVEARGRIVAPGFIDVHSHSEE